MFDRYLTALLGLWLIVEVSVIELLALSELVLPARVRLVAFDLGDDGRVEQRIERARAAA